MKSWRSISWVYGGSSCLWREAYWLECGVYRGSGCLWRGIGIWREGYWLECGVYRWAGRLHRGSSDLTWVLLRASREVWFWVGAWCIDGDVRTTIELLLRSTALAAVSISILTIAVGNMIFPLNDTVVTGDATRQVDVDRDTPHLTAHSVPGATAIC